MSKILQEIQNLALLYIIGVIMLKIVFYKEHILMVAKVVSSFFWMFIIPGFAFMYLWHSKVGFFERFVISVAVSAVLVGVTSYYLGLMGLHARYHPFIVPFLWLLISAGSVFLVNRKSKQKNSP